MSDESLHWIEASGGGLGFECAEEGAVLCFEADDTAFDFLVEEEGTKKRIRIQLTEDDLLWLYQLIDEARRCG